MIAPYLARLPGLQALVLGAGVLLGLLLWMSLWINAVLQEQRQILDLEIEHNETITRLDELNRDIAQAAMVVVETGDLQKQERHTGLTQELEGLLARLGSGNAETKAFVRDLSLANDALVALETAAITAGAAGDWPQARSFLFSQDYLQAYLRYHEIVHDWDEKAEEKLEVASIEIGAKLDRFNPKAALVMAIAILAWTAAGYYYLRQHHRLRIAQRALEAARDNLEHEVLARTAELEAARAVAEAANAAKSTFLAQMSHEIRTPMNAIMALAAALSDSATSDQQRRMLGVVEDASADLKAVLEDILDASKIEAGKLDLVSAPFELVRIAHEVEGLFRSSAERKGLAFKVRVDQQAMGWYQGDAQRLRQILANLVSNAVKFTDQGAVDIHFSRDETEGLLTFSVEDTGPGLSADDIRRLFAPFEQLDQTIAHRFGGSGLGLSIARRLARLMGGDITATGKPGEGAKFTLAVPLLRTSAPEKDLALALPSRRDGAAQRDLTILVAEDNERNRYVLEVLLARINAEVVFAEDGAACIEAFTSKHFDLVLMDVQMPVIDGCEATRRMRAWERAMGHAPTPIVAVSANALPDQVKAYLACGMCAHVAKPIVPADLLRVIGEALERRERAA